MPQTITLEEPNLHSFHCLLDVPQCVASNYEVLLDPRPGETMYRRGFTLTNESKAEIITLAQSMGQCDTCADDSRVTRGFRANITGTVVEGNLPEGAPPLLRVTEVIPVVYFTDAATLGEVSLAVGDRVTVTGFIMDNFCIERGTLLDAPSVVTLQEPDLHSVHCLIDVPSCAQSNYEVLLDPAPGAEDPMYSRGFVLDEAGKEMLRSLAMEVGVCSECDGTGNWEFGFRAQIMGTVEELGMDGEPPVISVQMARPVLFDLNAMTVADDAMEDMDMDMGGGDATTATDGEEEVPSGPVDCTQFQSSHTYEGIPLTLDYVVNVDEATGIGNFSGRVVYEGKDCRKGRTSRRYRNRDLSSSSSKPYILSSCTQ
jgi:hypothetical protein